MVDVYVSLILKGLKSLEQVPEILRDQVEQQLEDLQN